MNKIKSLFKNRKFRYGSIATIITVCVLAVVILLNVVLSIVTTDHPISVDVTQNNFYGMSQQTIDYLATLDKDIEIVVLNEKEAFKQGTGSGDSQYYNQASNIIDQYSQHSDKISISYVDMVQNPAISTQYSEDNLQTNDIIVKCGDQYKVLTSNDIFNQQMSYQTYSYTVTSSKAEQAITSAILNVSSDEKIKVQFIKGYDEANESTLSNLLKTNNYDVSDLSIFTTDIPDDTKLAIIFAPKRDYDMESIDKLNAFMEKGNKSIAYIANPEQGAIPNLNSFLAKWGINVGDGTVFESSPNKLFSMNSLFYAITDYASDSSAFVSDISQNVPVAMPLSKPITILESKVTTYTLLQFSKTSGIYPADADESWTITDDTISGPIPATVISIEQKENSSDDPTDISKSRVAVIGSAMAFDSSLLSKSAVNNSSYFLSMFNSICDRESTIIIEAKSIAQQELGLTAAQSIPLGITFVIVLPLLLIAVGLFIWLRRRNK